jgi:iron-sulfur cluster repair protein YtfE (RIC family)
MIKACAGRVKDEWRRISVSARGQARPASALALCLIDHSNERHHARLQYKQPEGQTTRRMKMDAITLLKADHEKVDALFSQLEETTERAEKTRQELFTKLKQELDLHAHVEEKIFYPALKESEETRDITMEGIQEHHVVKVLLRELDAMEVTSETWTAKLKVLKENVEHHVEEEEDDMFKKARNVLSTDQLEELGALIEEEKREQKTLTASAN